MQDYSKKTGVQLIAEERNRQITQEGFDTAHDSQFIEEMLAWGAVCYLNPLRRYLRRQDTPPQMSAPLVRFRQGQKDIPREGPGEYYVFPQGIWPKGLGEWKPTPGDRIRDLVKGCAMGIAEIDRLLEKKGNHGQTGCELVELERMRQIEKEGFSREHDRGHIEEELVMAAICYIKPTREFKKKSPQEPTSYRNIPTTMIDGEEFHIMPSHLWPWDYTFWKPTPTDRVRELVKGCALGAAEIDRLIDRIVN